MFPVALSISVAILAGIWTWAAGQFGLLAWPGFVSWAIFFAAGGDVKAIMKALVPAATGMIMGLIVIQIMPSFPGAWYLPVAVTIAAFILVMISRYSIFAFVPAAFAGCATYFGALGTKTSLPIIAAAFIPFAICIFLGYISAILPGLIKK